MTNPSPLPPNLNSPDEWLSVLDNRPSFDGWSYKLIGGHAPYGLAVPFDGPLEIDEKEMSVWFPYADGNRRDGVGDLLEVTGIDNSRHILNPICLFDHAREVKLPIGLTRNRQTKEYTDVIDPTARVAKAQCWFYQGTGVQGLDRSKEFDHAVLCQQLFDLVCKELVRSGSIGYQVKQARQIPPDFERGIPAGLHLLSILKLEVSLVVLPANMAAVRQGSKSWVRPWVESAREILAMPQVTGYPLSPVLVKSLTPVAEQETKVVSGYEGKGMDYSFESNIRTALENWKRSNKGSTDFNILSSSANTFYVGIIDNNSNEAAEWITDATGYKVEKRGGNKLSIVYPKESKELSPLSETNIPPAKWRPGLGAVKDQSSDDIKDMPSGAAQPPNHPPRSHFQERRQIERTIHKPGISPAERQAVKRDYYVRHGKKDIPADEKGVVGNVIRAITGVVQQKPKPDYNRSNQARASIRPASQSAAGPAFRAKNQTRPIRNPIHPREAADVAKQRREQIVKPRKTQLAPGGQQPYQQVKDATGKWSVRDSAGQEVGSHEDTGMAHSQAYKLGTPKNPHSVVHRQSGRTVHSYQSSVPQDMRKDMKELRQKYRGTKGLRKRARVGKSGSSMIHVGEKDISAAREMAEGKGISFEHVSTAKGLGKVRLSGGMDEIAKSFGKRRVKVITDPHELKKRRSEAIEQNKLGTNADEIRPVRTHVPHHPRGSYSISGTSTTSHPPEKPEGYYYRDEHGHPEQSSHHTKRPGPGQRPLHIPKEPTTHIPKKGMKGIENFKVGDSVRVKDQDSKFAGKQGQIVAIIGTTFELDFSNTVLFKKYQLELISGIKSMSDHETKDIAPDAVKDGDDLSPEAEASVEHAEHDVEEEQLPSDEEQLADEKYSAKVLRRLHQDALILLEEYDELRGPLEHEEVDSKLQEKLQSLVEEIESIEDLFAKHHPDATPLDGIEDKDLEEEQLADSEEVEEVPEEEMVEGMKSFDSAKSKELRSKYKALQTGGKDKALEEPEGEESHKSVCPECGKDECECPASDLGDEEYQETEESEEYGEDTLPNEPGDEAEEQEEDDGALQEHEKVMVKGAHDFLEKVGRATSWGDEERMDSWHHGKNLEGVAEYKAARHGGYKEGEALEKDGEEITQEHLDAGLDNDYIHPHRKMCGDASGFLRELSQERAFGDAHREKALGWHKAMGAIFETDSQTSVQEGNEVGAEIPGPGEMGEKAADEIKPVPSGMYQNIGEEGLGFQLRVPEKNSRGKVRKGPGSGPMRIPKEPTTYQPRKDIGEMGEKALLLLQEDVDKQTKQLEELRAAAEKLATLN